MVLFSGWVVARSVSIASGLCNMAVPQLVPCLMASRRVGLQPNRVLPSLCPQPKYLFPDLAAQEGNQPQATKQRRGVRILQPPPTLSQISIQS